MTKKISGVILAGGINSRFDNVIKANIEICGVTIIHRIVNTISGFFDEIFIVSNTPEQFPEFKDVCFVNDIFLKTGPLGGIHASLKATTCDAVFVFAGDMPLLDKRIIMKQIEDFNNNTCDILIPQIGNNIEPLHAIYNTSITPLLEEYLLQNSNYAIRDFIRSLNVRCLQLKNNEENIRAFSNVNTPDDKRKIEEILEKYS